MADILILIRLLLTEITKCDIISLVKWNPKILKSIDMDEIIKIVKEIEKEAIDLIFTEKVAKKIIESGEKKQKLQKVSWKRPHFFVPQFILINWGFLF